jgi:hypothetical protein
MIFLMYFCSGRTTCTTFMHTYKLSFRFQYI